MGRPLAEGWGARLGGADDRAPGGLEPRERGEVGPKAGRGGGGEATVGTGTAGPSEGSRGTGLTHPPTEPPAVSHPHHLGTPALMNCKVFEINVF